MLKRTIILHPTVKSQDHKNLRNVESKFEEAQGLALAIDLEIVLAQIVVLQKTISATYIGSGKIEEFAEIIKNEDIALLVFNDTLTPIQQRNLEVALKCKVIDRTALILEIFGERASTKEGRLQVELAAQEYQKSRLVRSWTHLERQRGGSGKTGGPGEKQIESDRRMIRERISLIKKRIKKVAQTRELQRQSRRKVPYDIVALVGYTNAGKSTLFNKITGADVLAEDKLFATLDPTMRLIELPSGRKVILSDTVGFISDLPTELVAAFRATLEEVVEADIILHVRDISNEDSGEQKKDVLQVLKNLGLESKIGDNMVEVLNKIDLLDDAQAASLADNKDMLSLSAITGKGVEQLLAVIDKKLSSNNLIKEVEIPCENGKAIAWAYAHAEILQENEASGNMLLKISISEKDFGRLQKMIS